MIIKQKEEYITKIEAMLEKSNETIAEIEKMAILQTLQRTNWNKQEAAQILGLYRPTLYSKMKKHHIRDARAERRRSGGTKGRICTA